jgi:hypothetical protein
MGVGAASCVGSDLFTVWRGIDALSTVGGGAVSSVCGDDTTSVGGAEVDSDCATRSGGAGVDAASGVTLGTSDDCGTDMTEVPADEGGVDSDPGISK